jgi:hypothetical protein
MCQREYQRELKQVQLPTIWTIPERMWHRIQPLLPSEKDPGTPGRPPLPFRKVMNGILFVQGTYAKPLLIVRLEAPPGAFSTLPLVPLWTELLLLSRLLLF